MPYLIPEPAKNPLVDEIPIRGFCVYLPDDVGFISAFVGAYQFFTKWVAYERDSSLAGKRAAHMFQIAYDKTMESFYNEGCGGDMDFDCETMKDCLIEVARAISVNVTVNNSCGVSSDTMYCVNDDGDITINPPPIGDLPVQPVVPLPPGITEPPEPFEPGVGEPPPGWEDWEAYDEDACLAANGLVSYAREFFFQNGTFLSEDLFTMAAALVVIVNMLTSASGFLVIFDRALLLKIVEVVGRLQIFEPVGEIFLAIADYIDDNRQEFVCELYTARGNASDWENIAMAKIFQFAESLFYTEGGKGFFLDMLAFMLPGGLALNLIYKNATFTEGTAVDCSICTPPPDYWKFEYTTGFEGETELDVITNQPGDLEIECWLKAASDTGPFVFFAYIENVNVQPLGKIDVTFTPTLSPKTWFMRFYDATDGLLYTSDTLESGLTSIEFEGYSLTKRIVLHMTDAFYFEDPPHFDVRLQVSGLSVEV